MMSRTPHKFRKTFLRQSKFSDNALLTVSVEIISVWHSPTGDFVKNVIPIFLKLNPNSSRILLIMKLTFVDQIFIGGFNPLTAKVKVTLCQRAPRLPASPSLLTFHFHSLVVSLSDIVKGRVFMISSHLPVKGLKNNFYFFILNPLTAKK